MADAVWHPVAIVDPDLKSVIDAWEKLPQVLKNAVLAITAVR